MAAPVPSHHERNETCETRPKYREGKKPTAVKVYTVNQESMYLLVQGVPAVGATKELIQLFAVYGKVLEYHMLDNHPAADKFTDVVLVKFEKIQSARFAKKKLDDWSFYGGVLHVCYSPEYETIEETRLKLKERRISLAARIKRLDENSICFAIYRIYNKIETCLEKEKNSQSASAVVDPPNFVACPDRSLSHNSAPVSEPVSEHDNNAKTGLTMPDYDPTKPPPPLPGETSWKIPPPPQTTCSLGTRKRPLEGYEFARVPSAHATLPKHWQEQDDTAIDLSGKSSQSVNKAFHHGRIGGTEKELIINNRQTLVSKTNSGVFERKTIILDGDVTSLNKSEKQGAISDISDALTTTSDVHPTNSSSSLPTSNIIVKDYKPRGVTRPMFVPRQTMQVMKNMSSRRQEDDLDRDIKKNALQLGDKQGPVMKNGELCVDKKQDPEERSVTRSQQDIRKRLSNLTSTTAQKKSKLD